MSCQKTNKKKLQLSCISLLEGTRCAFLHMCFKYIQQFIFYSLRPINTLEPQMQSKLCLGIRYKHSFKRAFKLTHSTPWISSFHLLHVCVYICICEIRIYNATEEKYNPYACQLSTSLLNHQYSMSPSVRTLIYNKEKTCFSPLSKDNYNTLPHVLPGTVLQWCSSGIPPHPPHKIPQDW